MGKHLRQILFLIILWRAFLQNETPTQVLSYEFCGTFKNIIFTEQIQTAAYGTYLHY